MGTTRGTGDAKVRRDTERVSSPPVNLSECPDDHL